MTDPDALAVIDRERAILQSIAGDYRHWSPDQIRSVARVLDLDTDLRPHLGQHVASMLQSDVTRMQVLEWQLIAGLLATDEPRRYIDAAPLDMAEHLTDPRHAGIWRYYDDRAGSGEILPRLGTGEDVDLHLWERAEIREIPTYQDAREIAQWVSMLVDQGRHVQLDGDPRRGVELATAVLRESRLVDRGRRAVVDVAERLLHRDREQAVRALRQAAADIEAGDAALQTDDSDRSWSDDRADGPRVSWPWPGIPGALLGGRIYVIGASTGVGKTSAALHVCRQVRHGAVLYASVEQTRDEIAKRLAVMEMPVSTRTPWATLASYGEASVDGHAMTWEGRVEQEARDAYAAAWMQGDRSLRFIGPTPGRRVAPVTADAIHRRARQIAADGPLSLVVVDYVQALGAPAGLHRPSMKDSIDGSLGEIKDLALAMDCPVVVVSQLNRSNEADDLGNHRLKGSSLIEDISNGIVLLERHDGDAGEVGNFTALTAHMTKHREGGRRRVSLRYCGRTLRMDEIADRDPADM